MSASSELTADIPLVREALAGLRRLLRGAGIAVVDAAVRRLDGWQADAKPTPSDNWFVWSGPDRNLCEAVLASWPDRATVDRIFVRSPFWGRLWTVPVRSAE